MMTFQTPLILLMNPQHGQTQNHQEEECHKDLAVVTKVRIMMPNLAAPMTTMITKDLPTGMLATTEAHK